MQANRSWPKSIWGRVWAAFEEVDKFQKQSEFDAKRLFDAIEQSKAVSSIIDFELVHSREKRLGMGVFDSLQMNSCSPCNLSIGF